MLQTKEPLTTTQSHKKIITQENNLARGQSHRHREQHLPKLEINHQKSQVDFEARGGCQIKALVRQTKGRFSKTGKKCFCRTTEICHTNFSPPKTSCPHGNSAPKSHLKTTHKMSRSRSWKFPQQADVCSEISLYLQWIQTNRTQ